MVLRVDKDFIERFPVTKNSELAEEYGVSVTYIQQLGKGAGLVKDPSLRKWSPEQRAALAWSPERKAKISGANHHNWKGGRPIWERFKAGPYQEWRKAVLERDQYRCRHCGEQFVKNQPFLDAHHIKSYKDYVDLRFEVSNGLALCRPCHRKVHGRPFQPVDMVPCQCGCGTMIKSRDKWNLPRKFAPGHVSIGRRKYGPPSLIECACGCGTLIEDRATSGRARRWVNGHAGKKNLGRTRSAQSREKQSVATRGRKMSPRSPEHAAKIGAAKRGQRHTPEARAKMSVSQAGRKHSHETRAKMSAWQIGKQHSEETKRKIAARAMGRKVSEAARAKMRAGQARRRSARNELCSADGSQGSLFPRPE